MYLSLDASLDLEDIEIASIRNAQFLLSGNSYTQTQSITIPDSVSINSYYILVKTDAHDREEEFENESNNVGQTLDMADAHIPSPLFLYMTEAYANPSVVNPGDPITLTWTVENTGGTTEYINIDHAILLSEDDVFEQGTDWLFTWHVAPWSGLLEPGGQYTVSYTFDMFSKFRTKYQIVGDYYLFPWPEPGQRLGGKYIQSAPITVTIPDPPDLHILSVTTQASALSGQNITLGWTVENQGEGGTRMSSWNDAVFLSDDQIFDDTDQKLGQISRIGGLEANQKYERIAFPCILPAGIEGDYYILISTDHDNAVYETDDTNNIKSTDAPITITIQDSDLEVQSVIIPTTAQAGQTIQIEWEVVNSGTETTAIGTWKDRLYLSQDDTLNSPPDNRLGKISNRDPLDPDNGYYKSLNVILPQRIEGNYYLIIKTDADNTLYEHNGEDNNNYAVSLNITDPAPDLAVESFTPASSGIAKQSIQVDWQIKNTGTATAHPTWKDAIFLSQDNTLDTSIDIKIATFDHTQTLPMSLTYGPDTSSQEIILPALPDHTEGTYYLFFVCDTENRLYEKGSKENNVSTPKSITITERVPDLEVQTATAPSQGIAGDTITIDWSIRNVGDAPARAGWSDAIYLSEDTTLNPQDYLLGSFTHPTALNQNQTTGPPIQPANITLPDRIEGIYSIFIKTDQHNTVYEKDAENNNTFLIPSPIQITTLAADLQVTTVNAPITGKAGTSITITWQVKNRGDAQTDSSTWKEGIYLSPDTLINPASDLQLATITHTGSLMPDKYYQQSEIFILPEDLFGTYYLYVASDILNQVYEHSGEDNNITQSPGSIQIQQSLVDLTISSLIAPDSSHQADTVNITWSVINNGDDQTLASSWDDTLYLCTKNEIVYDSIPLQTFKHQGILKSQESYTTTKTITLPNNTLGSFYLILKTDSSISNDVFEYGKENNNTASVLINIGVAPTADLIVTDINFPSVTWSGQQLTIEWTVTNQGTAPTIAPGGKWSDTVYLSRDPYLDKKTDFSLGNAQHQGDLAVSGTYTSSLEAKLPEGVSGPYFLIIITDSSTPDHVFERDLENNNTQASEQAIDVNLTPPADLVISSITLPESGIYGKSATWSYEVTNIGDLGANGAWYDILYLSSDTQWDLADKVISDILHEGNIAVWENYKETFTASIPAVVPGNYYVIAE